MRFDAAVQLHYILQLRQLLGGQKVACGLNSSAASTQHSYVRVINRMICLLAFSLMRPNPAHAAAEHMAAREGPDTTLDSNISQDTSFQAIKTHHRRRPYS